MKMGVRMKKILFLAACSVAISACGASAVQFTNSSANPIAELYLSAVGENDWGIDHLGGENLDPGDSHTITGIECSTFDVRIVDPDGTECVMPNETICLERSEWVLTESMLVSCQDDTEDEREDGDNDYD